MSKYYNYIEILTWTVVVCIVVVLFTAFVRQVNQFMAADISILDESVPVSDAPASEPDTGVLNKPDINILASVLTEPQSDVMELELNSELNRARRVHEIIVGTNNLTFLCSSEQDNFIIYTVQYSNKESVPQNDIDLIAQQIANVYKLEAIAKEIVVLAVNESSPEVVSYIARANIQE